MNKRPLIQLGIALTAVCFIVLGVIRGENMTVLTKAVHICMECIGLG